MQRTITQSDVDFEVEFDMAGEVDAMQKRLADTLERKRIRAIKYLGNRWVLHPEYDSARHAHHNPSHKASAVLSVFLHLSGAMASGRV